MPSTAMATRERRRSAFLPLKSRHVGAVGIGYGRPARLDAAARRHRKGKGGKVRAQKEGRNPGSREAAAATGMVG